MRIALMSDLHREFYPDGARLLSKKGEARLEDGRFVPFAPFGPDLSKIRGRCDLLVVAGDFDVGNGAEALKEAARYLGVPVAYVMGNHEFYGGTIDKVIANLRLALPSDGAHLLDRNELALHRGQDGVWRVSESGFRRFTSGETPAAVRTTDSVRVLGCMLWTDFGLHGDDNRERCKMLAASLISDYRQIAIGPVDAEGKLYRRIAPADTHGFHIRDRNWLENRLEEPFEGETVVVTHMGPSMRSVPGRFRNDPLSAAFASDLDALIERTQPALWIHGHTHDSFDYRIGRTRVVCNPYGYYGQELNPGFQEDLVIAVGPDAESSPAEARPGDRTGMAASVRRRDRTPE